MFYSINYMYYSSKKDKLHYGERKIPLYANRFSERDLKRLIAIVLIIVTITIVLAGISGESNTITSF